MVKLLGAFGALSPANILVIGDFLLDTYTFGAACRISPEAPVAVVRVEREEHRAGGAGNVVLNLLSLGARVRAVGRVGADVAGDLLKSTLLQCGCQDQHIFVDSSTATCVKNRIIADTQQVVRVDREELHPLPHALEALVIQQLPLLLEDMALIAVSDYGKGFLTPALLSALILEARQRAIPVLVDPKGVDFSRYRGATLIKPNRQESYNAANLLNNTPLEEAAERLLQLTEAAAFMITCSADGIGLFYPGKPGQYFPVKMRQLKDVTGAGDTVLAMLSLALANGLSFEMAAQLANVAAGIAIEQLGCATVPLPALAQRLLEFDVGNKIFDGEHLFALQAILQGRALSVFVLNGIDKVNASLLRAIHAMKVGGAAEILVWWKDSDVAAEEVRFLATFSDVSYILVADALTEPFCRKVASEGVFVWEESTESISRRFFIDEIATSTNYINN